MSTEPIEQIVLRVGRRRQKAGVTDRLVELVLGACRPQPLSVVITLPPAQNGGMSAVSSH